MNLIRSCRICTLLVMVVLSMAISHRWAAAGTPSQDANWPRFMSIGSASSGGTAFNAVAVLSQLITDKTDSQATAQVTTGGGQCIQLTRAGDFEFSLADQSIAIQAMKGTDAFAGKPYSELTAVCELYTMYFHQFVAANSKIESIKDAVGKTMVVGGPGSGTEATTREVYQQYGIDYNNRRDLRPEYIGIAAGVELIQNRQADGITSITPLPFSAFVELAITGDAYPISMTDDAIKSMCAGNPAYTSGVIPAGTYTGQTQDIRTVCVPALLVADKNYDEQVVYEVTRLIYENVEYLREQNNAFKEMSLENALKNISIPLHPGAERYFKEKGLL